MGRRTEQRIAASLPVTVRGKDDQGNPFVQTAYTSEVSCSGARLSGLACLHKVDDIIEIEHLGHKASFAVEWIGADGTPQAGQIGVRCIDQGKYIWGLSLPESAPDEYGESGDSASYACASAAQPEPVVPKPVPWAGNERRQFPRRSCRQEAYISPSGESMRIPVTVTDICIGGCYVEMLSPLPLYSTVEVSVQLPDSVVYARGRICSSQPGLGMGIAFTGMGPDELKKLRQFVLTTANQPIDDPSSLEGSSTQPSGDRAVSSPAASTRTNGAGQRPSRLPTTSEALEAVVRVLFKKGILSSSELSQELQEMKAGKR
jgi:hypothetical protein